MYGTTKAFVILKNILLLISNKIGVFRLGKNKAETDSANVLWGKSVSKWWRKKNGFNACDDGNDDGENRLPLAAINTSLFMSH